MCGLEVEARKGRMSVHIHKGSGGSYGKKNLFSLCLPWWVAMGKRGGGVGKGDNRILCCLL